MLKVTKPAPNRVDIVLEGSLDSDAMRAGLAQLIEASEDIKNGVMLYKIPEFSMPTLGALGVELKTLPKLFGLLGKFDKCAFLSDSGWLRTAAEIEGALFPGIEIKSFTLTDEAGAEAWLAKKS